MNIFSRIDAVFFFVLLLPISIYAATGDATSTGSSSSTGSQVPFRFEIVAPTTAYVNESIDVTVRAVDKNGVVVSSYRGTILFNSNDLKAVLPYQSRGYKFLPEDRGEKIFSKGVTFKNAGTFDLIVNDLNDDIEGTVRVKVEIRDSSGSGATTDTITILTPENNSSQPGNSITVTGKTRKNYKVGIFLNNADAGSVIADSDGSFIKTISNLTEKSYILQARLYDGTNSVIATSSDIKFDLLNELPTLNGISIAQGTSIEAGKEIDITVDAEPSLSEVKVTLDGSSLPMQETTPGKYTGKTTAPSNSGSYDIEVSLKNNLGQSFVKSKALTITVTDKPVVLPKFQNVKIENAGSGGKVNFTFTLEPVPPTLGAFKILYGETASGLTKEVKTFSADKIKQPNGQYMWYIPGLESKKWYFKIIPLDKEDKVIAGVESEVSEVSLQSVSCTIGNVSGIRVSTEKNKSILTWDALSDAKSYNVYKKNADGSMTLVQNVKEPQYVIFLSAGQMAYADFGVKALCADGKTESANVALASRVQTGPALILFLAIISALVGLFITRKQYFMIGK